MEPSDFDFTPVGERAILALLRGDDVSDEDKKAAVNTACALLTFRMQLNGKKNDQAEAAIRVLSSPEMLAKAEEMTLDKVYWQAAADVLAGF